MRKKTTNKKQLEINKIIKKIVFTKKQGANKNIMKDLYKMRYGDEWEKYYSHN